MNELYEQLELVNDHISQDIQIFCESDVTYYNLRQFVTIVYRETRDNALKQMLLELLKVLAKLEMKGKPVPTVQKLKSVSPKIFEGRE